MKNKAAILFILLILLFATGIIFGQDIHMAARTGDLEKVQSLLKTDPQLVHARDITFKTPLHWAARGVHINLMRLLLEKGADVNANDYSLVKPIHSVVIHGHLKAVEMLVENGALLNEKDFTGETPLSFAIAYGKEEIVDFLISKGVNLYPKFKNSDGGTLLHSAASGGSVGLVRKIINLGLKVDDMDRYGLTPLHRAASQGHKAVVDLLVDQGADLNKKSFIGKTAFNYASENDHREVSDVLILKGSNQEPHQFSVPKGRYFGQRKPDRIPILFAPGLISSPAMEHGAIKFSPDWKEIYWSKAISGHVRIVFMRFENSQWTEPKIVPFAGQYQEFCPCFSSDGNSIFYVSLELSKKDEQNKFYTNIMFVERKQSGWADPKPFIYNTENDERELSISRQGAMYFTSNRPGGKGDLDIYVSDYVNNQYTEPVNLGDAVNTKYRELSPFISPDGSYLIFTSDRNENGLNDEDLHISFKNKDGTWTESKNMGTRINSDKFDTAPYVTPDGKYLFFWSNRNGNHDIYWVDSIVIEELKQNDLN